MLCSEQIGGWRQHSLLKRFMMKATPYHPSYFNEKNQLETSGHDLHYNCTNTDAFTIDIF